jgi:hypothetical protein
VAAVVAAFPEADSAVAAAALSEDIFAAFAVKDLDRNGRKNSASSQKQHTLVNFPSQLHSL